MVSLESHEDEGSRQSHLPKRRDTSNGSLGTANEWSRSFLALDLGGSDCLQDLVLLGDSTLWVVEVDAEN